MFLQVEADHRRAENFNAEDQGGGGVGTLSSSAGSFRSAPPDRAQSAVTCAIYRAPCDFRPGRRDVDRHDGVLERLHRLHSLVGLGAHVPHLDASIVGTRHNELIIRGELRRRRTGEASETESTRAGEAIEVMILFASHLA